MKKWMLGVLALGLFAGCSDDASNGKDAQYTKAQAAQMGGRTSDGKDLCDLMNWYGDGVCDTFCPDTDQDCATACTSDADCRLGEACVNGTCGGVEICGGLAGLGCDADEYCHYTIDAMCGAADQTGECRTKPEACTADYSPVCGCDGQTYSNACSANGNGVSVASLGECGGGVTCASDSDCGLGQSCVEGYCEGPNPVGDCGGLAGLPCATGEYCNYAIGDMCGAADQMGTCTAIPDACTDHIEYVCGCDGNTYGNPCEAAAAGISVYATGACDNACNADGDCSQGEACINGVCQPVAKGCGARLGDTCGDDEFCAFTPQAICGRADATGVCQARPEFCPENYDPVCGCDGQTYSNACAANAAGASVDYAGECQAVCASDGDCGLGESCVNNVCLASGICGGIVGAVCKDTQWCDYGGIGQMCGAADMQGTCRDRPDACIDLYDPVCGCDGKTYSNGCYASAAGADVLAAGPCN